MTVLLLLGGVPWYWPPGTVHPVVVGLPLWVLVSMAFTVALAAHLSRVCRTQWSLAEEEEESADRERAERGEEGA